jgi:hypothetical protein
MRSSHVLKALSLSALSLTRWPFLGRRAAALLNPVKDRPFEPFRDSYAAGQIEFATGMCPYG